ncbi:hypothetical protein [Bdellovibrio sp. HCB337]|uniref:hypothetical protein n=1 Tax=Bdellovibrio sp. HCB337 TaxID=3394358 RepID=UPI0039A516D0
MKLIAFVVINLAFASFAQASNSIRFDKKFENFDGSETYVNPRVLFAGESLVPAEVYKATRATGDGGYWYDACVDFTNRTSQTSEIVCRELGFSKVVGLKQGKVSSAQSAFASAGNGVNGTLDSIEEYQGKYPVQGVGSYGRPFTLYCAYAASAITELTCK